MHPNQYSTLVEAIEELRERGYKSDFKLREDGMESLESGKKYKPDDMKIVEYYRFEGMTNPSDMSALFAVDCHEGEEKGLIVTSYGIYADINLISFLDKVKILEEKSS